jgi:hypothetical protein
MHAFAALVLDRRARFWLSIRTDLLGLFFGRSGNTRLLAGELAGIKTDRAMSTLGRLRARFGSVPQSRQSRD